jgi:LacI family transcriptional regulator
VNEYTHLHECIENNIPIIFFDRICHEIETIKITTDDFTSAFIATEHLIKNGCKKIAYLSIAENLSIDNKRMQGYSEALSKHDIEFDKSKIVRCNNDDKFNYKKIKQLIKNVEVDGIFSSIEKFALSTYSVCKDLGINIPDDIKIISFSNIATADFLSPALTTITQPAHEMGVKAASELFKYLDKKRYNIPNENFIIKSTLTVRDSSVSKK